MALTLANLITETRTILTEATPVFYTDAQITQWLQHGARDISLKTRCFEADATIAVLASTLTYTAPTDAIWIHTILNASTGLALTKIDYPRFGHITETSTSAIPLYWMLFNDKIWLTPLASAGSTLTVLYVRTTETVTDIPDEYRWMLIDYAVSRGLMRNKQYIEALALTNIYNANVQIARHDTIERGVDTLDDLTLPDTTIVQTARAG